MIHVGYIEVGIIAETNYFFCNTFDGKFYFNTISRNITNLFLLRVLAKHGNILYKFDILESFLNKVTPALSLRKHDIHLTHWIKPIERDLICDVTGSTLLYEEQKKVKMRFFLHGSINWVLILNNFYIFFSTLCCKNICIEQNFGNYLRTCYS